MYFCDVFNCLPVAAIIEDKIFCVHGGISPDLESFDQIRSISRPCEIPESGLLCDLVWSDPDANIEEWNVNDRGAGYTFGEKPIQRFLNKFSLDLLVRGHQAVSTGYDFAYPDARNTVTVFSAPNYCYTYMNKGGVMNVEENLRISFYALTPIPIDHNYFIGPRPGTPPIEFDLDD